MPKRRKRTNRNVPAKGRLRDFADRLWSVAVKDDWNWACAICGSEGDLNSHHLVPRQFIATRYLLENGVCLCRRCHQFCPERSPHQNPAGFMLWLETAHLGTWEWYTNSMLSGSYLDFAGTKNAAFYIDQIQCLESFVREDEYEEIVGLRFAEWLRENVMKETDG